MPQRSLLIFNLRTDADDSVLGFTTDWINALAPFYDHVDVITMHAGRLAVAANVSVYSAGRERGYSEARRALRFYRLLLGLLLRRRYVACFAHMMPLFALMAAPLLTLWRVRCVLWYTHRQRTRQLAWATRLVWRVVSATQTSFPIPTPKLRVLGHGIRTDFYTPPAAHTPQTPPLVIYVARLTPIKRQALLIEAARGLDCRVALIGDVPDGFDTAYAAMGSDAQSLLGAAVGAKTTPEGCLVVDRHQRTNVPGLYAAGDVTEGLNQIAVAVGQASIAATAIRNDLCMEHVSLR